MTRRMLATVLLGATLSVAFVPTLSASATDDFVQAQKQAARQLSDEGRLAEALALWRTLLPLGSPDDETRAAIGELESDIKSRVTSLLRKARRAYANGRSGDGDTYMLRVLALQPGQPDALARLRSSHSAFAQRQQREKSEEEYRAAVKKAPPSAADKTLEQLRALQGKRDYQGMLALAKASGGKPDKRTAPLLREAHVALADQAEQGGRLDEALQQLESAMALQPLENDPLLDRSAALRGQLSTSWYQRGTRLIKTDLAAAIAALRRSLDFNPYNDNARRKLAQAETLQRNLSRIEGGR